MSSQCLLPQRRRPVSCVFQGWLFLSLCWSVLYPIAVELFFSLCLFRIILDKVADSNRLICCKSYNCYWLVTLHHYTGDFSDPEVALWSSRNFQMLSSVRVSGPVHDAAFSPSAASQMACVGTDGVYFCFLHTQGQDADLKVNDHKKSINTHNKIFLPDQEFWAT